MASPRPSLPRVALAASSSSSVGTYLMGQRGFSACRGLSLLLHITRNICALVSSSEVLERFPRDTRVHHVSECNTRCDGCAWSAPLKDEGRTTSYIASTVAAEIGNVRPIVRKGIRMLEEFSGTSRSSTQKLPRKRVMSASVNGSMVMLSIGPPARKTQMADGILYRTTPIWKGCL